MTPAPAALGSEANPPLEAAPGRYVMEDRCRSACTTSAGRCCASAFGAASGRARRSFIFNGISANIELVEPFLDALDGSEAIIFDVPASAARRRPAALRPSTLARLSARLLDQLGHEQVDVLGVSCGGALAQQFAFQQGRRCRRSCWRPPRPAT